MRESVHERFLNRLIHVLNDENERRIYRNEAPLDVAFLIAPVEQHIADPQFEEFTRFLEAGDYDIYYVQSSIDDGYFVRAAVQVVSHESDDVYVLMFTVDERMWGYCQCSPNDPGYDPKRRCCGNGCDWVAPAFLLEKRRVVGRASWSGLERDYWAYEDAFNAKLAALNADLEKAKKAQEAEYLRAEIARLQERLKELGQYV